MDEIIQDIYRSFKKFIKNNNLPEIIPIYDVSYSKLDNVFSYVNPFPYKSTKVEIHISPELFEYKERFYKSILFHEFTHIFDLSNTLKNYNATEQNSLMSTYSEYHASQIELLCNLGYTSIPIYKKFYMSDKVVYQNEIESVEETLTRPLSDALAVLNKNQDAFISLPDKDYNIKYVKTKKNIMYYLGKYNVCQKYATTKPFNFFDNFGEFKQDILNYYILLNNKDFKNIIKCDNVFRNNYFNYFKFSL